MSESYKAVSFDECDSPTFPRWRAYSGNSYTSMSSFAPKPDKDLDKGSKTPYARKRSRVRRTKNLNYINAFSFL